MTDAKPAALPWTILTHDLEDPGGWSVWEDKGNGITGLFICSFDRLMPEHRQDQAGYVRLIEEAGVVSHETGLTPRQLAGQRSSLLDACKNLRSAIHSCDLSERDREILKPWLRQATNAIVAAKPEGHA